MSDPTASAVIVIAHGSRNSEANDAHRRTCEALAERIGRPAVPAFLELAEPTLTAAVADLAATGATRIVVLPYFLYPGRHMREDIPALMDQARAETPGVGLELGPLFGDDPRVVDILAAQLDL